MTDDELKNSISQISSLWPDWQANDAQVALWRSRLVRFDRDSVKLAITEYKAGARGGFKSPKLHELLEHCSIYQRKMHIPSRDEQGMNKPALDYALQCIEHIDPKYIGRRQEFYCAAKRYQDPYDKRLRIAHVTAKHFEFCYGGRWVPVMEAKGD